MGEMGEMGETGEMGEMGEAMRCVAMGGEVLRGRSPSPVSYTHLTLPTNREV